MLSVKPMPHDSTQVHVIHCDVLTYELTKGYNLYLLLDDRDSVMSREVASGEMGRERK